MRTINHRKGSRNMTNSMDITSNKFAFLLKFYNKGKIENPRFFHRLGNPDINGCNVLEIGCGTGSLAVYMVETLGAAHVLSIDIEKDCIAFAQANLTHNHPALSGKIEYSDLLIEELPPDMKFDCIVSKDSFEHIIDFKRVFFSMAEHLNPGGRILSGFGPLWESYKGGHALTVHPFDHLLPEQYVINRYNKRHHASLKTIKEHGLNKLKLNDYLNVFAESGLRQDYIRMNINDSRFIELIVGSLLKIPFLRRFTYNVYVILSKQS